MKLLVFLLFCATIHAAAQKPEIGIVTDMENDSLLHALGYHYMTESISKRFSPLQVNEEAFVVNLAAVKKMKTTINACNIFIPTELKLVGPTVNESAITAYVTEVFKRCQLAGVKMIVWGSGGARRLPDGYDRKKATLEFIQIVRTIAPLAEKYDIMLALENINSSETNFINTVQDVLDIVQQVNHPNLGVSADIYHMLKENESPDILKKVGKWLVNCEVAEKENRAAPGTYGENFGDYLKALSSISYHGKITIECRWKNLTKEAGPAKKYLQDQIDGAYHPLR